MQYDPFTHIELHEAEVARTLRQQALEASLRGTQDAGRRTGPVAWLAGTLRAFVAGTPTVVDPTAEPLRRSFPI